MTKYPKLNSIKLNKFSPNASFKLLLHIHSVLLAMGVCETKEAPNCVKSLIEAFREKLFNLMLLGFGFIVLFNQTPCIYMHLWGSHAFVAMQSIMLQMESVCQGKLACAIRA